MNTAPRVEQVSRLVVQSCAAAAGGAALVVAVGWLFGQWSFATFGAKYVPMAPGTAWLLVLLNAALFLHSRWPQRRASRIFGGVVVGFTGILSLLVAARAWFPMQLEFEAWLAHSGGDRGRGSRGADVAAQRYDVLVRGRCHGMPFGRDPLAAGGGGDRRWGWRRWSAAAAASWC